MVGLLLSTGQVDVNAQVRGMAVPPQPHHPQGALGPFSTSVDLTSFQNELLSESLEVSNEIINS